VLEYISTRIMVGGAHERALQMAFIDTETLATPYLSLLGTTTGHEWLSRNEAITFIALEATPGKVAVLDNRLAVS
jgi:hypothetical protein